MKIGVYILHKYAKQTYSKECYNVRLNAGIEVVCDILRRAGYEDISYCSSANVSNYDMILYSVTSDCDWWEFIAERSEWPKGNYKVCVGGQGVLNVRPFLQWVDFFMLGRAEGVVAELANAIAAGDDDYESEYCINSRTFSPNKIYRLKQVDEIYPYDVKLGNDELYHEDVIGCNHKCLFCGYTWHRKPLQNEEFRYTWQRKHVKSEDEAVQTGIWKSGKDIERAMIDLDNGVDADLNKLRTTAIDGFSERLRYMVNKKISREMLRTFTTRLASCEKPHQVKYFNIVGYPTETEDDWFEFLEDITSVDAKFAKQDKQTCILLHSTPFRPMPATPLACAPMSYRNYRGQIAKTLGQGRYKGNIFYQGNALWAVESMGTESLATVIQSAIVWRGTEKDADNFLKVARSSKFRNANMSVRQRTLEHYFDVDTLFGSFAPENLPTRYLRTYCKAEKLWQKYSNL